MYSYDVDTTVGQMRLVIPDNDVDTYVFEDDELEKMYELGGNSILRGCAFALEAIASSEAYTLKMFSALDLTTNGPAVSKELRDRAKDLRAQALEQEAREDGGAFDFAEWVLTPAQRRNKILNTALENRS